MLLNMKKYIILLSVAALCVVGFAAPKSSLQQAVSCLWTDNGDGAISRSGLTVTDRGALIVGNGTLPYWGSLWGEALLSSFDTANGDPAENKIFIRSKDGADEGYFDVTVAGWGNAIYLRSNPSTASDAFAFMATNPNYAEVVVGTGNSGPTTELRSDGTIRAGGSDYWKLGSVVPATVQLVTDKYVQVEIGGQVVKLAIVE